MWALTNKEIQYNESSRVSLLQGDIHHGEYVILYLYFCEEMWLKTMDEDGSQGLNKAFVAGVFFFKEKVGPADITPAQYLGIKRTQKNCRQISGLHRFTQHLNLIKMQRVGELPCSFYTLDLRPISSVAKMAPMWLLLSNDPSTFVVIPSLSDINIVPCMSSVFRHSPSP